MVFVNFDQVYLQCWALHIDSDCPWWLASVGRPFLTTAGPFIDERKELFERENPEFSYSLQISQSRWLWWSETKKIRNLPCRVQKKVVSIDSTGSISTQNVYRKSDKMSRSCCVGSKGTAVTRRDPSWSTAKGRSSSQNSGNRRRELILFLSFQQF